MVQDNLSTMDNIHYFVNDVQDQKTDQELLNHDDEIVNIH